MFFKNYFFRNMDLSLNVIYHIHPIYMTNTINSLWHLKVMSLIMKCFLLCQNLYWMKVTGLFLRAISLKNLRQLFYQRKIMSFIIETYNFILKMVWSWIVYIKFSHLDNQNLLYHSLIWWQLGEKMQKQNCRKRLQKTFQTSFTVINFKIILHYLYRIFVSLFR